MYLLSTLTSNCGVKPALVNQSFCENLLFDVNFLFPI